MRDARPRRAGDPRARAPAARGARTPRSTSSRSSSTTTSPKIARDVAQRARATTSSRATSTRASTLSQKSLEFIQGELKRLAEQIARDRGRRSRKVKNDNPGKLPEDLDANQRAPASALLGGHRDRAARAGRGHQRRGLLPHARWRRRPAFSAPNDDASPARRLEHAEARARRPALARLHREASRRDQDRGGDRRSSTRRSRTLQAAAAPRATSTARCLQQQTAGEPASARRCGGRGRGPRSSASRIWRTRSQALIVATPAVAEQLDALEPRVRAPVQELPGLQQPAARGVRAGAARAAPARRAVPRDRAAPSRRRSRARRTAG